MKNIYYIEDLMKYKISNHESLFDLEGTAGQLAKHFSINLKLPLSYIGINKINKIRTENANNSYGFVNIYSAKALIEHAIKNGATITVPMSKYDEIKSIVLANSEIEILKSRLENLNNQISEKEFSLKKIQHSLNVSGKQLQQALSDPLLDEDEILLLAGIRRTKCGVYFLIKDEQVVYVGQSININQRVYEHKSSKDFDTFTYVQCKRENLNQIEALYIQKLKPKYNYNSLGRLVLPIVMASSKPLPEELYSN